MKKIILVLILVVGLFSESEVKFYEPSFSCSKVKEGSIEYKICVNEELTKLDKELSKIYSDVKKTNSLAKKLQLNWLKKRNRCSNTICIKQYYQEQIINLKNQLNENIEENKKVFSKQLQEHLSISKNSTEVKLGVQMVGGKVFSPILLEHNQSIKEEFEILKTEYGDFCSEFYSDLFQYKNIKIIKPIVKNVDYNNTSLVKEMGACHKMGMELSIRYTGSLFQKKLNPPEIIKSVPMRFSLWKGDFNDDGKEEILFSKAENFFLLDENQCQEAVSKKNFNPIYDRKFIDKIHITGSKKDGRYYEVQMIKYKGKDYLFRIHDRERKKNKYKILIALYTYQEPSKLRSICYKIFK